MPVRLASHEELPPPLAGYTLVERLGRGGFGEVWKVEAPGGFLKAAKFVFGNLDEIDSDEARPAEQELKALKRMRDVRHPFIVNLERVEAIDGQLILLMELAEGNLWDRFRQCRNQKLAGIPRDELLGYLREAADALDYMNDVHRIQHLDVKPQNIFLMANHAKVADFGLAKYFEGDRGTMTGGVTPVYAAPETFESRVTRFTDQYSLAIVYQELLTGRRPFDGSNVRHLMNLHLTGTPDTSPLSPGDRAAVERALSKTPADRWPSCRDLMRAIERGDAAANPNTGSGVTTPPSRASGDTPVPNWANPPSARVEPPTARARPAESPKLANAARMIESLTSGASGLRPRLVTPQGASGGSAVQNTRPAGTGVETGRMSDLGIAPPERTGDGVLTPAIVIGVGGTGLAVLRELRAAIKDRFGSLEAVPTLKFLYIDTDPAAVQEAQQGPGAFAARDVLAARLLRPAHYLQHPILPPVEPWLPPGLLYRLPKSPTSASGVRAFGKLALCDHHRNLAGRIRDHLKDFLTDDLLDRVGRDIGLGVRSNRVRAFVVAGLGGGTGSGMALDLAYLLKHELRSTGYRTPECVGFLLAPPADAAPLPAVNAAACLGELYHYTAGGRYQWRFEQGEAPVTDADGPFTRAAVLALPRSPKPSRQARVHSQAARALYMDLVTPTGRKADEVRNAAPPASPVHGPAVTVCGLHRLTWPRPELVSATATRFARRLLERWAAREQIHLIEPVARWIESHWPKTGLAPEAAVARLGAAAATHLGEEPEAVFEAFIDTLRTRTPGASRVDAAGAAAVLDDLLKLVGKPVGENDVPTALNRAVEAEAQKIRAEAEAVLSDTVVTFIERPQYRLAGAEQALAQFAARLNDAVQVAAARRDQLRGEVAEQYRKIFTLLGTLGQSGSLAAIPGRKSMLTHELFEQMRVYPTVRLAHGHWSALLSCYQTMLVNLPEFQREVNDCRARLTRVARTFADAPEAPAGSAQTLILPEGCPTVAAAADRSLDALSPDDTLKFDQELQAEVRKRFKGVANLSSSETCLSDFAELLARQARAFIDSQVERTDPAEALLRYRGPGPELDELLRKTYDAALPVVAGADSTTLLEASLLATPDGPAARQVRDAASQACPGDPFIAALSPDDILIYRELVRVPLRRLAHLGPAALEAIRQQQQLGNNPHTRADVSWVRPPG